MKIKFKILKYVLYVVLEPELDLRDQPENSIKERTRKLEISFGQILYSLYILSLIKVKFVQNPEKFKQLKLPLAINYSNKNVKCSKNKRIINYVCHKLWNVQS